MFNVEGKYNNAKIFATEIDEAAISQVIELCNQEFTHGSKIRIMPDAHAGAGCTIGTTMEIKDKVVPNLVGVDIGCGMTVGFIDKNKSEVNFDQLDNVIRCFIPHGQSVRNSEHELNKFVKYKNIVAPIRIDRAALSIGTLGGGNHFIEINEYQDKIMIVIHSGSRSLGKEIATYYQGVAYNELTDNHAEKQELINKYKKEGREKEIQKALSEIKPNKIRKEFAYLQGQSFKNYLNDMDIAQQYASLNRSAILSTIATKMNWTIYDSLETIHNYIDMKSLIMRKGAVSAKRGELLIIPINMKEGSILGVGKGNPDWNYSGPHGAGRLMSRTVAKQKVNLNDFKEAMKDVWTTSVNESTLDESPFAYKNIEDITENIKDTIDLGVIVKPLYNFKSN